MACKVFGIAHAGAAHPVNAAFLNSPAMNNQ
jgi:hypothetical protein